MANIAIWKVKDGGGGELDIVNMIPVPASLNAASERLPSGAYTTLRTFNGNQFIHLQDHINRLAETAQLSGVTAAFDTENLRMAVARATQLFSPDEKRLRITLDLEEQPGALYIMVEALHTPNAEMVQRGVSLVTRRLQRENPKAKLTDFIETANHVRQELASGVHEALLIDAEGLALEGLSSNFFAVKNGEIWTAEQGVLSGITRSIVLEEAAREGIVVHPCGMAVDKFGELDEAFITSSSRAVLPVTRIDDQVIGSGNPGPITRLLLLRYLSRIAAEVEPA